MLLLNRLSLAYLLRLSKKSQPGFTLLELLITVIIIGILSSISIPAYVATVDKFHYGKAKIHMGCLKRELEGLRLEKGYFPPDVGNNNVPVGTECFIKNNTNLVPYNSKYDYENWTASGGCLIQISFFGKNKKRDQPGNEIRYTEPGFHEYKLNKGDDLILSLGIQPKEFCSP
ncbi:type II secretion system protein [Crocosphaera sp. XPORK-15E]|uniref:type II secretion system protein n=1 Tax=Crocosphaera sp. XPORK-15E TaxID=3110247 RepID=UPI002B1EC880|nr:prepilin-type N-terminal cleavage/methylation domain-containing protein [Crocosphaera sp. XPORK-15E]MEA5535709.1 prepilin-type N-terminal cleavage/methylation domain-containing protein [Crocosphaera sp. XPORK-15E]